MIVWPGDDLLLAIKRCGWVPEERRMHVTFFGKEGDWSVWIAMEAGPPVPQQCSWAIGSGDTQVAAFDSAKRALDKALDDLVVIADGHGVRVER
jgi:hypothetical protein